jgi:predicted porin
MQKKLIVLAIAGFAAAPAYAQWTMGNIGPGMSAQSPTPGVNIFGILDQAIESGNWGDGHTTRLTGGGYNVQRFGVRGNEDLGGGVRANFWLEAGLFPDVGAGGAGTTTPSTAAGTRTTGITFQQWNRTATVGLSWPSFGAINVGNQYTPWFSAWVRSDAFRVAGVGSSYALQFQAAPRMNNSLRYDSPSWGGLQLILGWAIADQGTAYGYAESVGGAAVTSATTGLAVNQKVSGRYRGLALVFDRGPWEAGLGYGRINSVVAVGAAAPSVVTTQYSLNGAYNFGVVKVLLGYSDWHNDVSPRTVDRNTWSLQGSFPFGPHAIIVGYQALKDKVPVGAGALDASARQLGLQYAYSMSRRTTLYATYGKMYNKDGAAYTVSNGTGGAALTNNASIGFGPSVVQAGIDHIF